MRERIVIFAAVLVSAGLVAVGAERVGPTTFSSATLTVTEGDPVKGGYVTTTDYAVLVLPTHARCPVIRAVPRDQIERIEVTDETPIRLTPKRLTADQTVGPCGEAVLAVPRRRSPQPRAVARGRSPPKRLRRATDRGDRDSSTPQCRSRRLVGGRVGGLTELIERTSSG